jgi:hypothetical protein
LNVPSVQAQVVERRVSAEGTGATRGHAIHDALINASAQAFGLRMQASTTTTLASAEINVDTASSSVLIDAFNKRISREVRTPGDRPILGYTIDQVERSGSLWSARVTIRHSDYEKLGAPSERLSMAVFVKPHPQGQSLLRAIEPALIATRRFDVLSRDTPQAFDREARFLRSGDAAPAELARLALEHPRRQRDLDALVSPPRPSVGCTPRPGALGDRLGRHARRRAAFVVLDEIGRVARTAARRATAWTLLVARECRLRLILAALRAPFGFRQFPPRAGLQAREAGRYPPVAVGSG